MAHELGRLAEAQSGSAPWYRWGPYLSERQWGTVREDNSADGNAWDYFPHDHARSRVYRWGEDGIAGFSDDQSRLCFALALWNGADSIIKERLFGLTNSEGNHGEDVKECYYYLDATPTHSYMRYLYKYPQRAYPYDDLVKTNRGRGKKEPEYEVIDTGVFDDDRYFDVFVEYAKATPEDILIRITACNRGPQAAAIHVLPSLWFRNTWADDPESTKPSIARISRRYAVRAQHPELGEYYLHCGGKPKLLFTENETNQRRIFDQPNPAPFVKDAINDYIVHGRVQAVRTRRSGTKMAAHYSLRVPGRGQRVLQLRLCRAARTDLAGKFDRIFGQRQKEADTFYAKVVPAKATPDEALVVRQALAGMIWSKQFYSLDVYQWLRQHGMAENGEGGSGRNRDWLHMVNHHVISMPDKWEYPWYAAWDLAFHACALSMVDLDFAKHQLELLVSETYLHPSGQIPAYEWAFSDANPPVHPWSALYLWRVEQAQRGKGDRAFLSHLFNKLMLNFTWWVNRKDRFGRNAFEGGFLGLDNIGVFDRSAALPTGGYLEQADGTAWMAMFCQSMLEMSVELAAEDPGNDAMAAKFSDHFLWIANAINRMGPSGMWDEEDGFYYDLLRLPDGQDVRLKVRSLVGLLPMCATIVIEPWQRKRVPNALRHLQNRKRQMPHLFAAIHPTGEGQLGCGDRGIIALVGPDRLRRILAHLLDEQEFLSLYGIRSISRYHLEHPYCLRVGHTEYKVAYAPAESDSGLFGGNSNWRGPIWMPMNIMIIRALLQFYLYYGNSFRVECPTGSGRMVNLFDVAREISSRLARIYLRDQQSRRPVFGANSKLQNDPHWRDYLTFYEYFHGDNGAGIGASHQTGWTGLIARIIQQLRLLDPQELLKSGRDAIFR